MNEQEVFKILLEHFGIYKPEAKYKIVCPFHDDKNASLQINLDKAYFFCYAECGAKGGYLELYKQYYKLLHNGNEISDLKAILQINKILKSKGCNKIQISKSYSQAPQEEEDKEGLIFSKDYYFNLPDPDWFKPKKNPSIYEETMLCRQYMNNRGFSNSILKKSGAKPSLNKLYPIIFPLLENGKFKGYVMRTFDPEVEVQRKYMYNKGFSRQRTLPGAYGKKTKSSWIVLVEGYLDCLKAQQFNIKSVGAVLGWKITENQINKIKKQGINTIICALDNDEAGNKGYNYLKLVSEKEGFKLFRVKYPKGIKDFGDLKRNTKELSIVLTQINKYIK